MAHATLNLRQIIKKWKKKEETVSPLLSQMKKKEKKTLYIYLRVCVSSFLSYFIIDYSFDSACARGLYAELHGALINIGSHPPICRWGSPNAPFFSMALIPHSAPASWVSSVWEPEMREYTFPMPMCVNLCVCVCVRVWLSARGRIVSFALYESPRIFPFSAFYILVTPMNIFIWLVHSWL